MRVRLPRAIAIAIVLIVSSVLVGVVEIWPRVFSPAHPSSHDVTYRVDGTGTATVEYGATAGPSRTKVEVTLPYTITLKVTPETPTVYTVFARVPWPSDAAGHSRPPDSMLPACSIMLDDRVVPAVVATAYNARECSYRP